MAIETEPFVDVLTASPEDSWGAVYNFAADIKEGKVLGLTPAQQVQRKRIIAANSNPNKKLKKALAKRNR